MKNFLKLATSISSLFCYFFVVSCYQGKIDPFDQQTGLSVSETKDFFYKDRSKKDNKSAKKIANVSIPNISKMITTPNPPEFGGSKLISLSITDQVPLKDVLVELGRSSKLDLDIDPKISGGVIINAKNRPLREILDRICEMGNVRYTYNNGILRFERDLPYQKHYLTDFLINADLWGEVESNLSKIISDSSGDSESTPGSVSSNKNAGIITVFASEKKQKEVAKYLDTIRKNSSLQVLIEAKVVEVALTDEFRTGIDWNWKDRNGGQPIVEGNFKNTSAVGGTLPFSYIAAPGSLFGGTINATVNALEKFGTVKAVSSPRINALNNQKATLNFTDKLVYFINDSSTTVTSTATVGTTTQGSVTSTKNEELTGTELAIVPTINANSNEVTLDVKPKISIKTGSVTQVIPNPNYTKDNGTAANLTNDIPIINTRELSTTAKIKSGNILVIGGLMTEKGNNSDSGIPFLGRIPVLGYLFKTVNKESAVTETVIFIKATIINSGQGVSSYDREIGKKFSSSARDFF